MPASGSGAPGSSVGTDARAERERGAKSVWPYITGFRKRCLIHVNSMDMRHCWRNYDSESGKIRKCSQVYEGEGTVNIGVLIYVAYLGVKPLIRLRKWNIFQLLWIHHLGSSHPFKDWSRWQTSDSTDCWLSNLIRIWCDTDDPKTAGMNLLLSLVALAYICWPQTQWLLGFAYIWQSKR